MGNVTQLRAGMCAIMWLLAGVLGALAGRAQAQGSQLSFTQAAVVGTAGTAGANITTLDVVVDGQGNTYAAGSFAGTVSFGAQALTSNNYDVFVTKRNAAGTYLWAVQGGGPGEQRSTALAVDAAGNVYVTGHFAETATATFGTITLTNAAAGTTAKADAFVAKLNGSSLAWEWANAAGGGTRVNGEDYGTAVVVDGLGNVYVAGYFNSSVLFFGLGLQVVNPYPGFDNVFLGKLTPAGTWAWVKGQQYMGAYAAGLTTDANHDVYLSGPYARGHATFGPFGLTSSIGEVFVAKIDGAGVWQWATGTGPTPSRNYNRSITISAVTNDGVGGLYVAGGFGGGASVPDTVLVGGTVLTNTGARETGPSGGLRRTFNGYLARLDAATGAWRWAVQTTGAGTEIFGRPLVDGAGHVYASGSFREPDFPTFPNNGGTAFGPTRLYSAGSTDLVVAQLDTAGRWQWARQAGGPAAETATLCRVDAQGRGVLLGTFAGATDQIGPVTLAQFSPMQTWWTYFLATLGANGPLATRAQVASSFAVYPNPAHKTLTLAGLPPGQTTQVLDALGRVVMRGTMPIHGDLQVLLPVGMPTGVYVVRAGAQAAKLVVE